MTTPYLLSLKVVMSTSRSVCADQIPSVAGLTQNVASVDRLKAGTPAFRATARAMFVGGFATFAMLYGMQPLMPLFSSTFDLSPAAASGVLSFSTGSLALSLIPASLLADRIGRKQTMSAALLLGAILMVMGAFASGYQQFLLLRTLFGIALAGLPAVAMAYLSEEVEPGSLGYAMGLYIAGNALGGMSGRFTAAILADWAGWRVAVAVLGGMGLLAAWEFWRSLPASRHFMPARFDAVQWRKDAMLHLRDPGLPMLFLLAFLLAGCFVSLYNYLGYRLLVAPFNLGQGAIGFVFALYVVGIGASTWVGRLADHFGRRNVLWVMIGAMLLGLWLTLADHLLPLILGIALFTFGFFAAHAVAGSWVGRRALRAKALASAFYLTAYYLGSSMIGSWSGMLWRTGGWPGIASALGVALLVCGVITLRLRVVRPVVA
ncbi:MFS transporter [Chitinivorax sp. B]|uniref:MFS transporter n=1 Tax=Chitinivorax sp. B TaxID=2502235 RepID=UPI002016C817|nr:MFS transporter [Chitinivorax sp. B]